MVLAIWLVAAQASAAETLQLKTQKDKVSYGIGIDIAKKLKADGG